MNQKISNYIAFKRNYTKKCALNHEIQRRMGLPNLFKVLNIDRSIDSELSRIGIEIALFFLSRFTHSSTEILFSQ